MRINPYHEESRTLSLDFAWLDFFCTVVLLVFCLRWKRYRLLARALGFGLFAFVMDYVLNYHITETRRIEYLENHQPMRPFGTLCFFFWFNTLNGAAVLLWGLVGLDDLLRFSVPLSTEKQKQRDQQNKRLLLGISVWFYLVPIISETVSLFDERRLYTSRASNKRRYLVLYALAVLYLKARIKLPILHILRIALTGVGCGLVHHLPLFLLGLRGYTSYSTLAITLLTEWPVILSGFVAFVYSWNVGKVHGKPSLRKE